MNRTDQLATPATAPVTSGASSDPQMSHALHAATLRAIRDTNDVDRLAALRSSVEHAYGRDPIGQRLVVLIIEKIRQLTRPPPPRLPDEPGG